MNDLSFQNNQRVGIFIDTQNLYHSARTNFSAHVNYSAMIEAAVHGRKLIRAFAYVIKSEAGDETTFFDALSDIGIEMRVKDLQIFHSGEKKADWDVGIAIDIVRMSEKLDAVVLVSGDGDFLEVLRYVKSRGIRAEVMAFRKTTSAKLLEEVDTFYDLGADPGKFLIPIGGRSVSARPMNNSRPIPPRSSNVRTTTVRPASMRTMIARPVPKTLRPPEKSLQPSGKIHASPVKPLRPFGKMRPTLRNVSKYPKNG